jgi:tripartite-type tricarboxylate transporter receptor subunit TctC
VRALLAHLVERRREGSVVDAIRRSLVVAAMLGWALPAAAQDYPSRVVTIIVPYPAGGPTDQLARALAPKFSDKLGQNFIVENVSGGATTIATGRVARAAPDGHTLLLHNLQISANVALHPNLPFDTEKELAPIAFINHNPLVLVGRKSLAPSTLSELIAWMRTTPAKMAHPGTGSTGHLATALFAQEAKAKVDHIPYRGAAPRCRTSSAIMSICSSPRRNRCCRRSQPDR